VTFRFSREPLQDPEITLYLIPLSSLRWLSGPGQLIYKPAFVYGPAHGIYRSFQRGCTDYLREPWDERELLARAERFSGTVVLDYSWGSILFCHGECTGPEGRVLLGPKEAVIFRTLVRFRGRCVSRSVLAHLVGSDPRPDSRAVDMQICSIRRKTGKILPLRVKTLILTCRPSGYMLR
jgi:DNA-binding response OmpR family regulator